MKSTAVFVNSSRSWLTLDQINMTSFICVYTEWNPRCSGELWWTRKIFTRLWPRARSLLLASMLQHPSPFRRTTPSLHWKTAVRTCHVYCYLQFLGVSSSASVLSCLHSRAATYRQRHLLHKRCHDGFGSSKPVGGFAGHRHAQRAPLLVPESEPVSCNQWRTCSAIPTLTEICSIFLKHYPSMFTFYQIYFT